MKWFVVRSQIPTVSFPSLYILSEVLLISLN